MNKPTPRGRELRPLPAAAARALDRLHARRRQPGYASPTCACGQRVNTWLGVICAECRKACDHRPIRGYIVQVDGRAAPRSYCGLCGERLADPPRGEWLYDCCFRDLREGEKPDPCARCGSKDGTQLHHWAPVAIFADADWWPMSFLCPDCHSLWHASMRAAAGIKLPWDERRFRSIPDCVPGDNFAARIAAVERTSRSPAHKDTSTSRTAP